MSSKLLEKPIEIKDELVGLRDNLTGFSGSTAPGYRTPASTEQTQLDGQTEAEAERRSGLDERQALTERMNRHNFALLQQAGFPGTVTLEHRWNVSSRGIGLIAKLMDKEVHKPRYMGGPNRLIILGTERGYYLPNHTYKVDEESPVEMAAGGMALTTEGKVYRTVQWDKQRNCAEIDQNGLIFKPYTNYGVDLEGYRGEARPAVTHPPLSELDIYQQEILGSEKLARLLDKHTRRTLAEAGLTYVSMEEAEAAQPQVHIGDTVEMPTIPTHNTPATPHGGLVNPADYLASPPRHPR